MKRQLSLLATAFVLQVASSSSMAQAQSPDAEKILALITGTADRICYVIADKGSALSEEVKGAVNVELSGLASQLIGAGVKGTGGITNEEYQGVLRQELATSIRESAKCKREVFESLQAKLLTVPVFPDAASKPDDRSQRWANVDDCVKTVFDELRTGNRAGVRRSDPFIPEVIVAELGPDLILGQLLVDQIEMISKRPRTYVLYELPPNSDDKRYQNYGHELKAGSTNDFYSIPNAILTENSDVKILIFDAFAKTGATLRDIKKGLTELGFKNVRTAVMGASKRLLDYCPDHICFLSETSEVSIPLPLHGSFLNPRSSR
jgi:hypothetical protein